MKKKFNKQTFWFTFIVGAFLWGLSSALLGINEPWDCTYPVYSVTIFISGVVVTLLWGRKLFQSFLGTWFGQFLGVTIVAFLLSPRAFRSACLVGTRASYYYRIGSVVIFVGVFVGIIARFITGRFKNREK